MTVSPLQGITHACFGLSYLCAFLLELARLVWPGRGWRVAGLAFGTAGVFAHSAYLLINQPPLAAPYGSLLLLAWVLALFYLYGTVNHAKQAWAVFVLPVVIGLVGLSLALVTASPGTSSFSVPEWAAGERFWGAVHGILILLASVGVSVSFLASVMYLIQARRLRRKVAPGSGLPMLSLERLETMNRHALNWAFPLLTAGLLVGTILLPHGPSFGDNWLSVKILSTAGLWLVFLVLLYLRYGAHVPARRLAWFSIGAFALLLVALVASHPFATGGAP
jgi:ABC-type transport system involved in cytochrome c biogenesis permease subunit